MASLQELPDDELDKLFRSSAEEFEPPYNPDDWNSLRRRLDDDNRLRFLDRFIYWGLPLLLLLLTTTSLLVSPDDGSLADQTVAQRPEPVLTQKNGKTAPRRGNSSNGSVLTETPISDPLSTQTDQPTDRTTKPAEPGEVRKNTVGKNPSETAGPIARSGSDAAPSAVENLNKPSGNAANTSSTNALVTSAPVTKNRVAKSERLVSKPAGRLVMPRSGRRSAEPDSRALFVPTASGKHPDAGQNRSYRSQLGSIGTNKAVDEQTATKSYSSSGRLDAENTGSETAPFDLLGNLAYIRARPPKPPILPALPEPDPEPMRPPVVPRTAPPAVPVVGYPALSIRVVAAPDLNFVGKSRQGARDFQAGVLAEYRFLRRFTVQAGVLRSVKKYRAAAADYAKPDHWYGPMYESVDAVCTVLDIPVNLRFDFLLNDRRRWFISSGVSSYIMQEEHYKYNYPYGVYPQPRYKEWNGKTGFHEWSHLNFSFGYERNFSSDGPFRRLSWQVEPFLKNPRRTTLGYGKIRLMSTGVFFSLRYRL